MNELTVCYQVESNWNLEFDLKDVADWYVKWDKLFVKHNQDDEDYEEYEPDFSALESYDFKRPNEVYLNDKLYK
jgi:hypothetical protein